MTHFQLCLDGDKVQAFGLRQVESWERSRAASCGCEP